jgi:hypothetical protein
MIFLSRRSKPIRATNELDMAIKDIMKMKNLTKAQASDIIAVYIRKNIVNNPKQRRDDDIFRFF